MNVNFVAHGAGLDCGAGFHPGPVAGALGDATEGSSVGGAAVGQMEHPSVPLQLEMQTAEGGVRFI